MGEGWNAERPHLMVGHNALNNAKGRGYVPGPGHAAYLVIASRFQLFPAPNREDDSATGLHGAYPPLVKE